MAEVEQYVILETLESVGGSTSRAAKVLGISPQILPVTRARDLPPRRGRAWYVSGAMFKKILVGLDGSPRQPAVLRQAVELANRSHGELHLVRAMQIPLSVPALAWNLQGDDFAKFLVEHGMRDLEGVEATLPAGLVAHRWCELAQPADLLCKLAADVGADIIVIGSHGYDRVDRLLGTTAAKVVNRAPCSVMVVREPDAS